MVDDAAGLLREPDRRCVLPWLPLAAVLATVLVVAALTAVPARLGGRRPVTETLQAELA